MQPHTERPGKSPLRCHESVAVALTGADVRLLRLGLRRLLGSEQDSDAVKFDAAAVLERLPAVHERCGGHTKDGCACHSHDQEA